MAWGRPEEDFLLEKKESWIYDVIVNINESDHEAKLSLKQTPSYKFWTWSILGETMPGMITASKVYGERDQAYESAVLAMSHGWSWQSGVGFSEILPEVEEIEKVEE